MIRVSPWLDLVRGREAVHPDHISAALGQLVEDRASHGAKVDDIEEAEEIGEPDIAELVREALEELERPRNNLEERRIIGIGGATVYLLQGPHESLQRACIDSTSRQGVASSIIGVDSGFRPF